MSHYRHHLFFCLNERDDGGQCCTQHNAEALFEYAKKKAKKMGLHGKGVPTGETPDNCTGDCGTCPEAKPCDTPPAGGRVNRAGCMDRCGEGPVCVVYPEAVWYTFVDEADIDEILESHLRDGKIVERLKI